MRLRTSASIASELDPANQQRLQNQQCRTAVSRSRAWIDLENTAFSYDSSCRYAKHPSIDIGRMNQVCKFCGALKWKGETIGMCCSSGKVMIEALLKPPGTFENIAVWVYAAINTFSTEHQKI